MSFSPGMCAPRCTGLHSLYFFLAVRGCTYWWKSEDARTPFWKGRHCSSHWVVPRMLEVQPVTHIHLGTAVLILAPAPGGPLQPVLSAHCNSSLPSLFPSKSMDGHFAKVIILCGALEPRIHLDPIIILIMIIINKAGILGGHLF